MGDSIAIKKELSLVAPVTMVSLKISAGVQSARLFDVLAGDPAAANDDEDLVLQGKLPEGFSLFSQARSVAACQDGAA